MFAFHGMIGCDIEVILYSGNIQFLLFIGLVGLQRLQLLSAAGYTGICHCGNHVAADRADIEVHFLHVAAQNLIAVQFTGQQLFQIHRENLGQPGKQGHVRAAQPSFP